MATVRIRYLICRPGAAGELPRYFWQPSSKLRAAGWANVRVPANWAELGEAGALEGAAIAAAQARNRELDAWLAVRGLGDLARPAAAPQPARPMSLAELVDAYRNAGYPRLRSADGHDIAGALASKTIREYDKLFALLARWAGDKPYAAIRPSMLRQFYEDLALERGPRTAKGVIQVAQIAFKFARLRLDFAGGNPADRLGLPSGGGQGLLWPRDAVAGFVATADSMGLWSIGSAVLINEWLGQREGDVLRFPRDVLEARGLVVRQNKTRAGVALPLASVPSLVARIEGELGRQADRGHAGTRLLLTEASGIPYKEDYFRRLFAAVRGALAQRTPRFAVDYLPAGQRADDADAFTIATGELQFMHLRHTAIVRLVEAGATVPEAAAISGHALKTAEQIVDRYLIRTGRMAQRAFQLRLDQEGGI